MPKLTRTLPVMGIYAIVHRLTGRAYIGSSVDVGKRWSAHRSSLRCARHENPQMQAAWDECGGDAFAFLLVERVAALDDLLAREQVWLDAGETHKPEYGYNRAAVAGGTGFRWTPEQRARASEQRKAAGQSDAWRQAMANIDRRTPERLAQIRALGLATKGVRRSAKTRRLVSLAQLGSAGNAAVLTEAKVVEIMWRLANEENYLTIARLYGVSPATIQDIKHGRSWIQVTGLPDRRKRRVEQQRGRKKAS